jgi:hypothetical protein
MHKLIVANICRGSLALKRQLSGSRKAQRAETRSAHALSSGLHTGPRMRRQPDVQSLPAEQSLSRRPAADTAVCETNQIDEMPIAMRYAATAANALVEWFEPARGGSGWGN